MRMFGRRRICMRILFSVGIISLLCISIEVIMSREYAYYNPPPGQFNYFLEADEHAKMGYVVDTQNCHILNISAWHKSILPFYQQKAPSKNCLQNRQWTYVENQRLILNSTAIVESGYTLASISCCYKSIQRVEQRLDDYDAEADSKIIFSEDCKPILGLETSPKDEFIRVFCRSKYWPWSLDVIYRYFHALPLTSSIPKRKLLAWRKPWRLSMPNKSFSKSSKRPPPNVILLGIDSMSRLSFQRNMPKTREQLIQLGAVEMSGYTKLGENTFPNAIAFTTGHEVGDLGKLCNYSMSRPLDDCPFIWRKFNEANYVTAFIEDVPLLATFNHYKVGFVEKPTDFYFRPFMLGVQSHAPSMHYYTQDCIGSQTVDETAHKYIRDILNTSSSQGAPAFIYTWLTNLAHMDLNGGQSADEAYERLLKRLDLQNTILFFMSDHGYRYGLIRQTFAGWYEDKLPNFWVYLPSNLRKEIPQWMENVLINSRRLTSPLDLHSTLETILAKFAPHIMPKSTLKPKPNNASPFTTTPTPAATKGISLFDLAPKSRRCRDAGVSENFCACVAPRRLDVGSPRILQVARFAVQTLNDLLPRQCSKLDLVNVMAGGVMEKQQNPTDHRSRGFSIKNHTSASVPSYATSGKRTPKGPPRNVTSYIVAFETSPGGFLFEATVDENSDHGHTDFELVGELLRMNKILTDVSCVSGDDLFEKYCFCPG